MKSDVWSFGATIVEFWTKDAPYPNRFDADVISGVYHGELNPMMDVNGEWCGALDKLLSAMFAVKEDARPCIENVAKE